MQIYLQAKYFHFAFDSTYHLMSQAAKVMSQLFETNVVLRFPLFPQRLINANSFYGKARSFFAGEA